MDDIIRDFVIEAREGVEALDEKLVRFEQTPNDPALLDDIFRLIHTLKGTSGFLDLSRLQAVTHAAENVLGAFRDQTLRVDQAAVSAILEVVDVVRDIIAELSVSGTEATGDDRALIARLDSIFAGETVGSIPAKTNARPLLERLGGEATLDAACETAIARLLSDDDTAALFAGVDLDHVQALLRDRLVEQARQDAPGSQAQWPDILSQCLGAPLSDEMARRIAAAIRDALYDLDADPEATLHLLPPGPKPLSSPADTTSAPPSPTQDRPREDAADQTIRVGVSTLEDLMTTVSELVLIRNQLIQTLRDLPETPFAGPLHRLNQVTSELQESVMTTRMQPIGGAWTKLPRLVRDLGAELGKSIALTTTGQDVELDRQVLEQIKDPLVHMVRNACDHGLETPAERRAAGKPETGRITLSARHEGGAIIVDMTDDGRGLNADRIRAKAVANGLIPTAQAAAMPDADVHQLIFAAGFSTAEQVTSVSGRGVGMDVVRTHIERIGGSIDLTSNPGEGTKISIRIPLTLSIVSGLIVESCGERFVMPQSEIVELVSAGGADSRRIEQINGAAVLRLRERLLPLVSLQQLLGLTAPDDGGPTDPCIVVARVGGFSFGVVVDRVFDTEEIVVKPVASILRHIRLYSGATILGDGAVIMILDFKGMAVEAGASHSASANEAATETQTASKQSRTLLVFRSLGGARMAAPLADVVRIEEIEPTTLEQTAGRTVIQYGQGLTPVLSDRDGADTLAAEPADQARIPLLIFARGERRLGVLAREIIDIVETEAEPDSSAASPGVLGAVIAAGQATELIDIAAYWRRADGDDAPSQTAAAARDSRRLLIVDQSPFTRLMLAPLLAQAGYVVEVESEPARIAALHERGVVYDLILADTTVRADDPRSDQSRHLASALIAATNWHATPLLSLGVGQAGLNENDLLSAVSRELNDAPHKADAA